MKTVYVMNVIILLPVKPKRVTRYTLMKTMTTTATLALYG